MNMSTVKGYELVGKSLKENGVTDLFFLMGAPILESVDACIKEGIRAIDVRHEQGAAFMAQAYSRCARKPGVCIAASGPGTTNFITSIANAYVDCAPMVILGGASPLYQFDTMAFQEMDQLSCIKPITKWSARVHETRRIPEYIKMAFHRAMSGKPGPVYLDLPGDILHEEIDTSTAVHRKPFNVVPPPLGNEKAIHEAIQYLNKAERPIIITGSGLLWSSVKTQESLQEFVELTKIPFYTSPQGRGILPDDHHLSFIAARSYAFRNADLALVLGSRFNYMLGFGYTRFAEDITVIQVDIDPEEFCNNRDSHLTIFGDAGEVIKQLKDKAKDYSWNKHGWTDDLKKYNEKKIEGASQVALDQSIPIDPRRLCVEVANFIDRDSVLVVSGQEILNYARQNIPTYSFGHRLNSGPFGCMGLCVPFGVGAKAAHPHQQVVVLTGDGSFGMNCMEMDTAVRFKLPILVVISNNAGWSAREDYRIKPGRELLFSRYDKMFSTWGIHGEYVEDPNEIAPALKRASEKMKESNLPAIVNVITEPVARASTLKFTTHVT